MASLLGAAANLDQAMNRWSSDVHRAARHEMPALSYRDKRII